VNVPLLKQELQADQAGLGYAPLFASGQDRLIADILNFIRDGATPCPVNNIVGAAITVRRIDISVSELYAAIDVADYPALPVNPTAAQLSSERRFLAWLSGLTALAVVRLLNDDGSDTPVVKNLRAMFAQATPTFQRLAALASRNGSRAEQLFGPRTIVTSDDVAAAR
jgi:hypothetical protein